MGLEDLDFFATDVQPFTPLQNCAVFGVDIAADGLALILHLNGPSGPAELEVYGVWRVFLGERLLLHRSTILALGEPFRERYFRRQLGRLEGTQGWPRAVIDCRISDLGDLKLEMEGDCTLLVIVMSSRQLQWRIRLRSSGKVITFPYMSI